MKRCLFSLGTAGAAAALLWLGGHVCGVQQVEPKEGKTEAHLLPLSTESVSKSTRKVVPTSVRWEGRDHDVDAGVELLMNIIKDRAMSASKRRSALDRLGMVGTQLKDRKCMDDLLRLYGVVGTRSEKAGILLCFVKSDDPRGVPLLYKVLDSEKDHLLRLFAADGLARWNIRRGVDALIGLFPSTVEIGERQLGGQAAGIFHLLSQAKGWSCPDKEMQEAALAICRGKQEQYYEALASVVRQWFDHNKERFPDWKPGDPLPEVPAPNTHESTGE